jgi:REP element-mobilizing transposase RayT
MGFGNSKTRPNEPPMPDPLAFFLTWTTYGTWLPGDERGWICKGKGIQLPDPEKENKARRRMTEPPCILDEQQRRIVERTVAEHCKIRGWQLYAVNCRTKHVHVVVSANCEPEDMRDQFKAWCTRRLKENEQSRSQSVRKKWWTERGSQLYIGDEESLEDAIRYVLDCQ